MTANARVVDADMYVLVGSDETLWERLSHEWAAGKQNVTGRTESLVRNRQSLPSGLDDWIYELVDLPTENLAALALPDRLPSSSLSFIPDTCGWSPLRIVSTRLKEFLLEEDSEGGNFYPFNYVDAGTGKETAGDFWYWLPKRWLRFNPNSKRGPDQAQRHQAWGALGRQDVTWEISHNPNFQNFISQFPYWTPSPRFQEIVFRRDLYLKMKDHGFTGFNEAASDNYLRQTPDQTIGYINFDKQL